MMALDKNKIDHARVKPAAPTRRNCTLSRFENGHLDPVHQHADGSWWFCDETWAAEHGPYDSAEDCREGCEVYAKLLEYDDLGGVPLMDLLLGRHP